MAGAGRGPARASRTLGAWAIAMAALVVAWAMGFAGGAAATTYAYTGTTYNTTAPYTACSTAPNPNCTNYTGGESITGSFTTATPLAANLSNVDVTPASFSFSDGINTYASTNPSVRRAEFSVTTNASGQITGSDIILQLWQSGTNGAHATNDRFAQILISLPPGRVADMAGNNFYCDAVGPSAYNGVAETCPHLPSDASSSNGAAFNQGSWMAVTPPAPVPTLSPWPLALLAVLMAAGGALALRRRVIFRQ